MRNNNIVLVSALVACALMSGCDDNKKENVAIEFMHSSVESRSARR